MNDIFLSYDNKRPIKSNFNHDKENKKSTSKKNIVLLFKVVWCMALPKDHTTAMLCQLEFPFSFLLKTEQQISWFNSKVSIVLHVTFILLILI